MEHELGNLIGTRLDRRRSLGARLVIIRGEERLTQQSMADKFGVSTRTYQDFEHGKRPVPSDVLIEISEAFSVNLNWLLRGLETSSLDGYEKKVAEFVASLLNYLKAEKDHLSPEGIAAIVSRWITELRNGRTISLDDVHIWIDMMRLNR
mgnify:CR=1 FL=1